MFIRCCRTCVKWKVKLKFGPKDEEHSKSKVLQIIEFMKIWYSIQQVVTIYNPHKSSHTPIERSRRQNRKGERNFVHTKKGNEGQELQQALNHPSVRLV